jgi:hypothetical protein
MQDLVQAEAQDDRDLAIQAIDGPRGRVGEQVVEQALPAERPRDDLGGQRAIARVGQPRADPGERGGQVGSPRSDGLKRL